MARGIISRSLAVIAVVTAAATAWAGTHTDDDRGFSFDVPDDWVPMSDAQLDAMNARVESAYRGTQLVAGYVRGTSDATHAPYFVVQVTKTRLEGLDYDEVAERLNIEPTRDAADRAQAQSANTIARMQMRRAALDRDNNRFVFQGSAGAPPMANLIRSSVGFLATDGVVTLHCFARARDAEGVRTVFDGVVGSFQFEEGFEYAQPTEGVSWFGFAGRVFVIGAVLVLVAWFLRDWIGRLSASPVRGRRRAPHRLFTQRYRLR